MYPDTVCSDRLVTILFPLCQCEGASRPSAIRNFDRFRQRLADPFIAVAPLARLPDSCSALTGRAGSARRAAVRRERSREAGPP